RNTVFLLLKSHLKGTYTDVSQFLKGMTSISGSGRNDHQVRKAMKNDFYRKLEKRTEDLTLSKLALKLAKEGKFDEIFRFRKEQIDSFEIKYSKFLDPYFTKSLIIIGQSLYGLDIAIRLFKKSQNEEFFEKRFKIYASKIIKELYILYDDFEFDIYEIN
ncbi:MAG: hypothetical protein ACE5G7_05875, partial [Candidatus Hydrothermarchaeaceae archaeon]